MKRLLLTLLIICLASSISAQVSTYGTVAYGSMMKKGSTSEAGFFVGTNTVLMSDSLKKITTYNRTGYFYVEGEEEELQSLSSFMITQKTFGLGKTDLYVAMGGGMLYEIQEGEDEVGSAIKIELGLTLFGSVAIAVGADHVPISGEADETFVYGLIDIFPF